MMDKLIIQMGEAIKLARKKKKMSQSELAERAGITQTYVSFLEKGTTFPQKDKLIAICQVLDLSIDFKLKPKK